MTSDVREAALSISIRKDDHCLFAAKPDFFVMRWDGYGIQFLKRSEPSEEHN